MPIIFHRVLDAPDPLFPGEVTKSEFETLLEWCKSLFNVVPLSDAIVGLKSGSLPPRPLVVTFDDGYADNHELAAPILRRLGVPATFFVASGYLDGGRMFNDDVAAAIRNCSSPVLDLSSIGLGRLALGTIEDRRLALERLLPAVKVLPQDSREEVVAEILRSADVACPPSLMMSSHQVADLKRGGFEIGAHTASHPILGRLDAMACQREIDRGRKFLEEITGAPVRFFAYPNGRPGSDYTSKTVQVVRELGFEAAFSTAPGVATARSDLFQLPRFTPWDRSPARFGLRMVHNLLNRSPLTADAVVSGERHAKRLGLRRDLGNT